MKRVFLITFAILLLHQCSAWAGDTCVFSVLVDIENVPPVFDPVGGKNVYEDTLLKFNVNAVDLNGDTLTYWVEDLPPGAGFDPEAKEFNWQPAHDQVGAHPVTFCASDTIVTARVTTAIKVLGMAELLPPNILTLDDFRLYIEYILPDGTVTPAEPYKIKGVCWSPSGKGSPGGGDLVRRKEAFFDWCRTDIPLIAAMGANTVRTYLDFGIEEEALDILDELYKNGIMAVVTVDNAAADMENLEAVVSLYKDHPAILMWAVGNEWNYNLYYGVSPSLRDAMTTTERMAEKVKELDPNHPVCSVLGHRDIQALSQIIQACPSVDVWGINAYLGASFHGFLEEYTDFSRSSGITRPIFISEMGADAYDNINGQVDAQAQAVFNDQLWWEAYARFSADDEDNPCLGAAYFEWNDEWWKAGGSPAAHDAGGFYAAQPDGFSNEEWYGLVDIDRNPRQVYHTLKDRFASYQAKDTVRLTAQSNEGAGSQWARFYKDGAICYSGGRGINAAVLDRRTGYFEAIKVFDTYAGASESARLAQFLSGIENGKIVAMAVSDEAANNLTQEAIDVIETYLGSSQIGNLRFRGSWAIISVKGANQPLAEALDNTEWADLAISAEIALDTDKDGIANSQDSDDDGDGISDADELAMGADPLDKDLDNDGLIDGQDSNIFAPELELPDSINANEGEAVDINIKAGDKDGNALTYKALNLPASASFDKDKGRFYWETSYDDEGVYRVIIIVTDGEYYDYGSFAITVNSANGPIAIGPVPAQRVNAGGVVTLGMKDFTDDPDGDAKYYVYLAGDVSHNDVLSPLDVLMMITKVNYSEGLEEGKDGWNPEMDLDNNGSITPLDVLMAINWINSGILQKPAGVSIDNATGIFQWKTGENDTGFYYFTIIATDGEFMDAETITIRVE